ncbi:MAG: hypothetical protein ORN49_02985 [Rhodobacteraceae bacterium]|nr:hypothetical protein [Paracoccaceae bacterium]
MTVLIGTAPLREVATGRVVTAEVFDGISQGNIDSWEKTWKPVIEATRARLAASGAPRSAHPQSAHWDWNRKATEVRKLLSYRTFCVVCGGATQGLMRVETVVHRSRNEDENGRAAQSLVYVDFLETAPWNRPEHVQHPVYRGVGQVLLATAIQLSLDEGFKGRIGLHSLPQSEEFYRSVARMTDHGPDSSYPGGLRYFELDAAGAQAFNQGGAL